jgi:hypothetical protein
VTSTLTKTTILERLRSRLHAQAAYAHAVHLLTAEPTGENVVRYLIASRDLERPDHALRRRPTQG